MRVNNVLDIFGAIIVLAAIAVVARNPKIVSTTIGGFNTALKTATNAGR